MKVIIAGSRSITDYGYVEEAAEASGWDITEVVSGTAAGVDKLGEQLARAYAIRIKQFPAYWKNIDVPGVRVMRNKYGFYNANAGHMRNAQMAEYADALIAVIENQSRGTLDMIKRMKALGKPVFIYDLDEV